MALLWTPALDGFECLRELASNALLKEASTPAEIAARTRCQSVEGEIVRVLGEGLEGDEVEMEVGVCLPFCHFLPKRQKYTDGTRSTTT